MLRLKRIIQKLTTCSLLKVTIPAQWESETQIAMDALIELGVRLFRCLELIF
jgi:hypothetical protein